MNRDEFRNAVMTELDEWEKRAAIHGYGEQCQLTMRSRIVPLIRSILWTADAFMNYGYNLHRRAVEEKEPA